MLPKPPQCLCYKFKANITDTKHQSEHVDDAGKRVRAIHVWFLVYLWLDEKVARGF